MTMRLFLAQPTTIFAARVNQASFTYPLAQVTFDTVGTGAFGDIESGMTVLFGSSAGDDDYGRQRVRKAATSTILYFGRSSEGIRDGEVDLADNAYITVLNDYRVWSKIPYIDPDGLIYKDNDIAVGTFTTTPPPVANAGAAMAGTIDSGTSKLRVTLPHEANTSFAVAGTISSYAWVLPTGVALVGGYALTDSQIEVDCDAGFYWIKLTVTDSNAETHTCRVPVYARDPASDTSIGSFTIESHRIVMEGQRLAVRVLENIAESAYPDGTLVMIWEDEPSTGADRSHMVFVGWHQTDPATIATERTGILRDTVLELLDVAGRLDTLPGFSGSVEVAAAPASWTQMTAPNMDKYLHYLLYWHSTALEVADWTWSGTTTTYPFVVLGNAAESLWDQAMRRAKALVPDYVLGCNTIGQIQTIIDPLLQDSGSRTATVQATLQESDWQSVRYTHQRPPRAHWLRGEAIVASASAIAAIFCVVPGESPGQGESPISQGEQLAVSQATLNACEGHRYARYNAPERYFSIVLAEGADQGLEPSDMTWLQLNVSVSTAAQRGLILSNERGLVREINVRYDHTRTGLVKQVELLWERETSGTPAVTVTMPEDGLPDSEWTPPDLLYDPDPDPDPDTYDLYSQFIVGTDAGMAYAVTADVITGGTPTWIACNGGIGTEDIKQVVIMQSTDQAYALTAANGIWRTSLPISGSSTWTQILANTDIFAAIGGTQVTYKTIAASWLTDGRFWLLCNVYGAPNWHTYVMITSNDWASFSAYHVGAAGSRFSSFDSYTHDIEVVHDGVEQTLYCSGNYGTTEGRLWKSTNGGTTWTDVNSISTVYAFTQIATHPGDANIVVCGSTDGLLRLSENGGSSFVWTLNISTNLLQAHQRVDGVGVAMPYATTTKQAYQYRENDSDMQDAEVYSSPWIDWYGVSQPSADDMFANDARCCGWSTNNKFGYVVSTGVREQTPAGPEVMQTQDAATYYTYVTQNLQAILGGATQGQCIGWEGGEFNE